MNAIRRGLAVLGALVLAVACTAPPLVKRQEVDVSAVQDLHLRSDIQSLAPAFPEYRNEPDRFNGEVDHLYRWTERYEYEIVLYSDASLAEEAFLRECGRLPGVGERVENAIVGEGEDRYFLSPVCEGHASEMVLIGSRGSGHYESSVVFLKGRVVIVVTEHSDKFRPDKAPALRHLAYYLAPFATDE